MVACGDLNATKGLGERKRLPDPGVWGLNKAFVGERAALPATPFNNIIVCGRGRRRRGEMRQGAGMLAGRSHKDGPDELAPSGKGQFSVSGDGTPG